MERRRILHPDIHRMNLDSYTSAFFDVVHGAWSVVMEGDEYPEDTLEDATYLLTNSLAIGRSTSFGLTDEEMIASCNKKWEEEQEKRKNDPPRPL